MIFIGFEEEYVCEKPRGVNAEMVCWSARKILAGYMMEGECLEIEGITLDDDSDVPVIYRTSEVRIGLDRVAHLSNRPFIMDSYGHLQPYTLPGYIAAHLEPDDLDEYEVSPGSADYCDQVIFQIPFYNPDTDKAHLKEHEADIFLGEAAIYHGFNFDSHNRIDRNNKELRAVNTFLNNLDHGLFFIMTETDGAFSGTFLSQTPECGLDEELNGGYLDSEN